MQFKKNIHHLAWDFLIIKEKEFALVILGSECSYSEPAKTKSTMPETICLWPISSKKLRTKVMRSSAYHDKKKVCLLWGGKCESVCMCHGLAN